MRSPSRVLWSGRGAERRRPRVLGFAPRAKAGLSIAAVATAVAMTGGASQAALLGGPVELVASSRVGWGVDASTGGQVCTVASADECRPGRASGEPDGFRYPGSVAADPRTREVYVADTVNDRVQKLTATGAFVATFGWGVNATEDRRVTATQAERNVCTASSGDVCGAGAPGTAAGALASPSSVAVDPVTGGVYVLEVGVGDFRVDKYTAGGRFAWMVGRHVNGATRGDLCTAREVERSGVKCRAGVEGAPQSVEPGAFKFVQSYGDLLAAGGPEDLLYVGDEGRVQKFAGDGRYRGQISLASLSSAPRSSVLALTVDRAGDLYLVYREVVFEPGVRGERTDIVRKFDNSGEQVAEFAVSPRRTGATVSIGGLAVDPYGHLAVVGIESDANSFTRVGWLYDGVTGRRTTEFAVLADNDGIAFDHYGDLYVAATDGQELLVYGAMPVLGVLTSPLVCGLEGESKTPATFACGAG